MSAIEYYLKDLLNGMDMDEKTKQDLYDEFYDHLTLSKLNYMKQGLAEEEAEKRCIKDFGGNKALRKDLQKSMFPKRHLLYQITWILFVPYILAMLYRLFIGRIMVFTDGSWEASRLYYYQYAISHGLSFQIPSYNLIPLKTVFHYVVNFHFEFLVDNILLFIPIGIFISILFPLLRVKRNLFIFVSLPLVGIELLQFLTHTGTADIDMVILRLLGVMIGVFLYENVRTVQISFGKKIKDFA